MGLFHKPLGHLVQRELANWLWGVLIARTQDSAARSKPRLHRCGPLTLLCEGSPGHAFLEPTIRFHGQQEEGFRALAVALEHGLPVDSIRRYWSILCGEPHGPHWEMTFREKDSRCDQ